MELNFFPMEFLRKETSSVCQKLLWYQRIPVFAKIIAVVIVCAIVLGLISFFTVNYTNGTTTTNSFDSEVLSVTHVIKGLNKSVNPCKDFYQFACGSYNHNDYANETIYETVKAILEENSTNDLAPLITAKSYYKLCQKSQNDKNETQNILSAFHELLENSGFKFRVSSNNAINNTKGNNDYNQGDEIGVEDVHESEYDAEEEDALELVLSKLILKNGMDAFIQISVDVYCPTDICYPYVHVRKHKELFEWLTAEVDDNNQELIEVIGIADKIKDTESMIKDNNKTNDNNTSIVSDSNEVLEENPYYWTYTEVLDELYNGNERFDWDKFFVELLLDPNNIIPSPEDMYFKLDDIEFLKAMAIVLPSNQESRTLCLVLALWKSYYYHAGRRTSDYVLNSGEILSLHDLHQEEMFAISSKFFRKVFNKSKHEQAESFTKTIMSQFSVRITNLSWLDSESRQQILKKIDNMKYTFDLPSIAYDPETIIKYYTQSEFKQDNYDGTSYATAKFKMLKFQFYKTMLSLSHIDGFEPGTIILDPVQLHVTSNVIENNHIYISPMNYLFPFYDMPAKSQNFGASGFSIAHEIIHSFDPNGITYKGTIGGNNTLEWNSNFLENVEIRSKCFRKQYEVNGTQLLGQNITNNGTSTLGDNIADNGGLRLALDAYTAFVKHNGEETSIPDLDYSPYQLFFISFAQGLCSSDPFEADDEHSYDHLRVVGTLRNNRKFHEVWNCPMPKDEDICELW